MVKGLYLGTYKLANRYLNTLGPGHSRWKPQKSSHGAQPRGKTHVFADQFFRKFPDKMVNLTIQTGDTWMEVGDDGSV